MNRKIVLRSGRGSTGSSWVAAAVRTPTSWRKKKDFLHLKPHPHPQAGTPAWEKKERFYASKTIFHPQAGRKKKDFVHLKPFFTHTHKLGGKRKIFMHLKPFFSQFFTFYDSGQNLLCNQGHLNYPSQEVYLRCQNVTLLPSFSFWLTDT